MINTIEFTIKNLNKEKRLRQILEICNVLNVKTDGELLKFTIPAKSKKKVQELLNKNEVTIISKKHKGLLSFFNNTILRIGVIIPICIFLFLILFSNLYIFNYKIMGNELVNTNEVIDILKNENVYGVIKKSSVNKTELENALLKIDKISLVSVMVKGNTLIINIKEKVYNQEYEEKDGFVPLKSEYNGIITEISLVQGTPLVKVGQTVRIGQELVAPYVYDTSGQKLAVKPMADIKADVFLTTITEIPNLKIEMVDTGNFVKYKTITLFGIEIFSNKQDCLYKSYRLEQSETNMSNNLLLPVRVTNVVYFEQIKQEQENYFQLNKDQIISDCQQKTRQLVGSCEIIKEEYKTITQIADVNQITYTVIVNKSIC